MGLALGQVIGHVGGGVTEKKAFSVTEFFGTKDLAAVTVPAGETWLIAAVVDVGASSSSYPASLTLTGDTPDTAPPNTRVGLAATSGPGTVTLTVQTAGASSNRAVTLTGTLYAVKL